MELVTGELQQQLLSNWGKRDRDSMPVVKIFNPGGVATWLFHSMDPDEPDQLYGLCDLGFQSPELGYASLSELQEVRIPVLLVSGIQVGTLRLERDLHFRPRHSLEVYTRAAQERQEITENEALLEAAAALLEKNSRAR